MKPAELLRDFVNTADIEDGTDELSSPAKLEAWLHEHGLSGAPNAEDLGIAIAVREGLRVTLRHGHKAPPALNDVLARQPIRVLIDGDTPRLVPAPGHPLAAIAAAIAEAQADGDWPRLKICSERTCQWAFIDSSKNRSRTWCSMRVCGNRTKTRAYRARQRSGTG